MLLVLIEESSATPHLLTRQGAIYVRNPGSSDPVPIDDQRRLLDLIARGEKAREEAWARSTMVFGQHHFEDVVRPLMLGLAATGVTRSFAAALFDPSVGLERLRAGLGDHQDTRADVRQLDWKQDSIRVARFTRPAYYPVYPARLEGLEVWRGGVLVVVNASLPRPNIAEDNEVSELSYAELETRTRRLLELGLEALLDLGAHGDVALALRLSGGHRIDWRGQLLDVAGERAVNRWIALDLDEDGREGVIAQVLAELGRAIGVRPDTAFG